ncbi:hypothetical protein ACJ73_05181 [Blastomyces percursus]|uniref:Mid2 domain-containing protein n=1 Tax=Blastomyces percursus TaxID=1658174 RepID=A0A1J9Q5U4_9EURO|nr:hypothetical protein ACJ73_05181 [Blastomyces percursus]
MRRIPFHSASRFSLLHAGLLTACLSPLLLSTPAHAASRKCYLPNGDVEKNDAPCFPQNPESACCGGSEYVCATNNMCAHYQGGYYVIGSCTDPTWNNPACPGYCFFRDHIHNSVYRCTEDTYCCLDGPECNCTTNANTQKIFDFLPPYSALVGSSVSLNTAAQTTSLFTPPGATPPPTPSTPGTSSAQSTESTESTVLTTTGIESKSTTTARLSSGSGTSGVNPTGAGEGGAGGPTPAPELPINQSNDNDIGMKIGLGVGIPLGVIAVLLAALVYRLWKRGGGGNVNAGPGSGPGGAGSGYASGYTSEAGVGGGSGGRAAAVGAGGIAGFFSRMRRKEDPASRIPMLANTPAAAEVPDTSVNQPMNGHGFSPAYGHHKPNEIAMSQTPRSVNEFP